MARRKWARRKKSRARVPGVQAAGCQRSPVGGEGHAFHRAGVGLDGQKLLAGGHFPEPDARPTCGHQRAAIRAKGNRMDADVLPLEKMADLARRQLPKAHGPVVSARGEDRSVGGVGDPTDARGVPPKDPHDAALGRTHRAQDRDVAALVLDQHDQPRHDVERGDKHDQRKNNEHDIAFDVQGVEESLVALAPVGHDHRPHHRRADLALDRVEFLRAAHENLDDACLIVLVEEALRLGQGHIDEEIVELRHADLKDRGDRIDLAARGDAERRLGAVRDQDFQLVADAKTLRCAGQVG